MNGKTIEQICEAIDTEIKREKENRSIGTHSEEWKAESDGYIEGLGFAKTIIEKVVQKNEKSNS